MNRVNGLLRIEFELFRNPVKFLIDSGASCSIISQHLVPPNVNINEENSINIKGINGVSRSIGNYRNGN